MELFAFFHASRRNFQGLYGRPRISGWSTYCRSGDGASATDQPTTLLTPVGDRKYPEPAAIFSLLLFSPGNRFTHACWGFALWQKRVSRPPAAYAFPRALVPFPLPGRPPSFFFPIFGPLLKGHYN